MLVVNETFSVAWIRDLAERCPTPGVADVLAAIIGDEDGHAALGWDIVDHGLAELPAETRPEWRGFVRDVVRPTLTRAEAALAAVPEARRTPSAWPEPALASAGLLGPERHALLALRTWERDLRPLLERRGL